jgi:hypothetical protein
MAQTSKSKAYAYRIKPLVLVAYSCGYALVACLSFNVAWGGEWLLRLGPMRFGAAASNVLLWLLFGGMAFLSAYYMAMLLCQLRFKHRVLIGADDLRVGFSQFSSAIAIIPYDSIESVEVRLAGSHKLAKRAKSILVIRSVLGQEFEIREKYLAGPKTFRRIHSEILARLSGPERQEAAESLAAMDAT